MPPLETARWTLCIVACAALAACSGSGKTVDYKSAGQTAPLEVPPDLMRPGGEDRFRVPDINPTGTATFSDYSRERAGQPRTGMTGVLPEIPDARVVREGNQRWLVVKGNPDQVWLTVKGFWQESGFIVNVEVPEAGILETDWAETRPQLKNIGVVRAFLSWALDQVFTTSERDKFRTRLERGAEPGTTEIYVSHRRMEEVIVGATSVDNPDTRWQARPSDPDLEAEMLRRLMVRFGVDDTQAKSRIASAQPAAPRATLSKGDDGTGTLALNEQFDRAWRRVGLALDRVGFTVEDRDRTKGIYFVRYIDPQADGADKGGFFSKLKFWGSDKPKPNEQFRIQVKDGNAAGCQVNVLNKDGAREQSDTAGRILALLYEQLK
ncbi:MAG TPA: outer membrane protein assembly factor BamC [Burkholderiales bacterium]|nr:outer membrane protein assembly factor BamC [Burkholderiales bacterium]